MIRLIGNDEVEERDTTDDNPQSSVVVELHSFINVETVISRSLLLDFFRTFINTKERSSECTCKFSLFGRVYKTEIKGSYKTNDILNDNLTPDPSI